MRIFCIVQMRSLVRRVCGTCARSRGPGFTGERERDKYFCKLVTGPTLCAARATPAACGARRARRRAKQPQCELWDFLLSIRAVVLVHGRNWCGNLMQPIVFARRYVPQHDKIIGNVQQSISVPSRAHQFTAPELWLLLRGWFGETCTSIRPGPRLAPLHALVRAHPLGVDCGRRAGSCTLPHRIKSFRISACASQSPWLERCVALPTLRAAPYSSRRRAPSRIRCWYSPPNDAARAGCACSNWLVPVDAAVWLLVRTADVRHNLQLT